MGGLLLSGGPFLGIGASSGGSSLRAKAELASLCAVPGLRPLGEGSRRFGDGYPLPLFCSGCTMPRLVPSYGGSSIDRCDLCERASSGCGRLAGLAPRAKEEALADSGVLGLGPKSDLEDCGVSICVGGVGSGIGGRIWSRLGGERKSICSRLGDARIACSIDGRGLGRLEPSGP